MSSNTTIIIMTLLFCDIDPIFTDSIGYNCECIVKHSDGSIACLFPKPSLFIEQRTFTLRNRMWRIINSSVLEQEIGKLLSRIILVSYPITRDIEFKTKNSHIKVCYISKPNEIWFPTPGVLMIVKMTNNNNKNEVYIPFWKNYQSSVYDDVTPEFTIKPCDIEQHKMIDTMYQKWIIIPNCGVKYLLTLQNDDVC